MPEAGSRTNPRNAALSTEAALEWMSTMLTSRHVLLLTGLFWLTAADTLGAEASQRTVSARPAEREITLTGFTRARAALAVVAETSGRVLEVTSDIGDTVGDTGVFARLDPAFIRLELEANQVEQARLRARIDYDEREAERYRTLTDKGSASRSRLDTVEHTLRDNRFALRALAVAEKTLEERLARTRVTVPAGWRIVDRRVEPGQWVSVGEVLAKAADFHALLVPFALAPAQYAALERLGDTLGLWFPDLGREVTAEVYRVNPDFDPETRKIEVDLRITGPVPERRGGLRAQLRLPVPQGGNTVLLPKTAVGSSYEEHWVTRADGQRIRVVLLGNGAGSDRNLLRVSSPRIQPGDHFLVTRKD